MAKKKYTQKQVADQKGSTGVKTDSSPSSGSWKLFLPGLVAVLITFICFSSSLNNEFVNWDDDKNFYENPLVQNVTKDNFWKTSKEIFSSGVIGNYNPLPIWTFAIEKLTFGFDNPGKWHLTNVLLHLICVFLVYFLSRRLRLGWQAAFLIALLFGIHPMRVESVAWVTERKDVLFGLFYLAALWQYVLYKEDQKGIRWVWMSALFLLSCFSKIQAVSLPLSMMALDYYLSPRRWEWSDVLRSGIAKIPFFLISLGFGLYGVLELKEFGSLASVEQVVEFSLLDRLAIGGYSFMVYLAKFVFPYKMSPLYPYESEVPGLYYGIAAIALAGTVGALVVALRKDYRALGFGLLFFIVNIVFLLQIVGAGQGFLADRFTYIAYFGLFFALAKTLETVLADRPSIRSAMYGGTIAYLGIFAVMTIRQNNIWDNSETLWTHVLQYYKNTTLPYGNRANYYRDKKMYKEALADYDTTIKMKDDQPGAYNSRARLYFDVAKGRDTLLLALSDYNKAIQYEPNNGEYWINRGATHARLGMIDQAVEDLNKGLQLKPDHASGYINRSIMYRNLGKIELSLKDIETYLTLNPYSGDLWYEKGNALRMLRRDKEAVDAYTQALQFDTPNVPLYYYERAKAYFTIQKKAEAIADYQQAISRGYKETDFAFKTALGQ